MVNVTDTVLFTLVHDFFKVYLPNERKYSANTVRAYRKALDLLFDYVKVQKNVKLNEITFEMIDSKILAGFLDSLENERSCSVSTRNHRLQCIRAFYGYCAKMESTAIVHALEIKKVPASVTQKVLVEHMSERAVEAILKAPDIATKKGLRDMFIMMFLYNTGARIQELLDIRLKDIRLCKTPTVVLHGKGGKTRTVPLTGKITEHLKRYLDAFHPHEDSYSSRYLFYVVRNDGLKRMTEDNARRLIHQYGVAARNICAEVPDDVHPHLFRHSRAMHLYRNGVDLLLVSQWLGHSKPETTLIYAHADTELKRKAIEKAIPDDSAMKPFTDSERFTVDDEDLLRQLCGLR